MTIQLDDLLKGTGGRVISSGDTREFTALCTRLPCVRPGAVFAAALTDDGDGHNDLEAALLAGAAAVVVEREVVPVLSAATVVLVDSVRSALSKWAQYTLSKSGAEVIAVAGSVGKTLARALIAHLLAGRFAVFQGDTGRDGLAGLQVALSGLEPSHQKIVLEMGCRSFNEVRDLSAMTHPRVGVVTAVDPSNLEYFGTLEAIAREHEELVTALPPNGLAVLNADDSLVRAMAARSRARVVTFGLSEDCDVCATDVRVSREGTAFELKTQRAAAGAYIPLVGRQLLYPALAAAAVALEYGLPLAEIAQRLTTFKAPAGRMRPLAGISGCLVLDASYNASPSSMEAGLDALASLPDGQRVAILGDMSGLGEESLDLHRRIGRKASKVVDYLVGRGDLGREIALEAVRAGLSRDKVGIAYINQDAVSLVRRHLRPGATILVTGSSEQHLEQVVAGLLAAPERAPDLLVRQGPEWRGPRRPRAGRATWLEVDLDAIANNARCLTRLAGPGVEVMAVVKANGYGFGAVKCAQTAINNGATTAGVACMGEAIELREAGITVPILVLGYTAPWQARQMVRYRLSAALYSMDVARALSLAAVELNSVAHVHLKVDSGMGRLGLLPGQVLPFLREIKPLPGLDLEGLFTHFAAADEADLTHARMQLAAFEQVVNLVSREGIAFRYIHASNSSGSLQLPEARFNLLRPGTLLYGMHPSADVPRPPEFLPAFALKCEIAQVKELPAGSSIGYGCTYVTPGPRKIAVIPIGYADGIRRSPVNWGEVLVRGRRVPIVGRVCMDQTMIDVTDVPGARLGDEVVLIGRQGDAEITMDEVAVRIDTVINEVTAGIMARVPRVS